MRTDDGGIDAFQIEIEAGFAIFESDSTRHTRIPISLTPRMQTRRVPDCDATDVERRRQVKAVSGENGPLLLEGSQPKRLLHRLSIAAVDFGDVSAGAGDDESGNAAPFNHCFNAGSVSSRLRLR